MQLLAELKEAYKSIKESLYDTKYAKNLDNLIETSQTFKEACRLCLPPHSAKRLSKAIAVPPSRTKLSNFST